MELGDSGWERRDFSRLLEQLWDSSGAPPQVLKYLGGCLAPTRLGEGGGAMSTKKKKTFGSKLQPDASVTAVLLSIKFDEEGFKCSASQVQRARRPNNSLAVACGKHPRAGEHSSEAA